MRSGFVAVMLVACGGKGAVLEIHTKAAEVEVWVSADDCEVSLNGSNAPCPHSIAWLSVGPKTPVDSSFQLLDGFPLTLTVHGGVASLELQAPADHNSLSRIVAVGYDPSGVPIEAGRVANGIVIPQGSREVWRLDLQPAEDVTAIADPNAGPRNGITERTHAWPVDGPHLCLVWQQNDGTKWTREVIAPGDDHDCDGFPADTATECDDFWFHYKMTNSTGVCTLNNGSGTGNACTLGTLGGGCVDGVGGSRGCTQNMQPIFCLPDIVCAACQNPLDPTCPPTEYGTSSTAAPTIGCTFGASAVGGPLAPCNAAGVTASVQLPFGCTQATLSAREVPPSFVEGPAATTFTYNGATFNYHVTVGSTACQIDLVWTAGAPLTNTLALALNVYIDNQGSQRALVLPIYYSFTTIACDMATVCSMNLENGSSGSGSGSDRMWDCAK